MFPFTNNGSDPISYGDQLCYSRPFSNDITTDPKHEESLLSFFHLPSPFIPFELGLEDVFLQQSHDAFLHHQQPLRAISAGASQTAANMMDSNTSDIMELTKICHKKSHNRTAEPIPRKRSSKRDRHSKINTAQGPRDRRMRLSLKVAREFFDLQDKLGFDKASKTVEWLLIQSRHEIKKLCNSLPKMNCSYCVGTKSASSTSECEVVSGIDETSIEGRIFVGAIAKPSACAKKETSACAKKERKPRPSRKTAFHPQAKESREKARARARERTREKLWNRRINVTKRGEEAAATNEMNNTGRWSSFEKGEESGSQSHEINPPMEVPTEIEAPNLFEQDKLGSTEVMIDETLVPISNWSPSTYFNHLHNPGILQQECQSSDLPVLLHIVGGSYNIQSLG